MVKLETRECKLLLNYMHGASPITASIYLAVKNEVRKIVRIINIYLLMIYTCTNVFQY